MVPECDGCGAEYPCGCPAPEYTCGGCNWEVSESDLDNVAACLAKDGLDWHDGLMCPACYVGWRAAPTVVGGLCWVCGQPGEAATTQGGAGVCLAHLGFTLQHLASMP